MRRQAETHESALSHAAQQNERLSAMLQESTASVERLEREAAASAAEVASLQSELKDTQRGADDLREQLQRDSAELQRHSKLASLIHELSGSVGEHPELRSAAGGMPDLASLKRALHE